MFNAKMIIILILIALAIGIAAGFSFCNEDVLPTGDEIFDKYITAVGGLKVFDKIESRVSKTRLSMPAQGLDLTLTVYAAKPNKLYMVIESDAFGQIIRGCNGKVFWEDSPMSGPVVKEGAERDMMLREMVLDKFVYWQKIYENVECVAKENVSGADCYKVTAVPRSSDSSADGSKPSPQTLFFDCDTGYLVKMTAAFPTPGGDIPMNVTLSEYRDVDGVRLPHKVVTSMMGQERVGIVLATMHNLRLAEDVFDLPEAIEKIVKEDQTGETK